MTIKVRKTYIRLTQTLSELLGAEYAADKSIIEFFTDKRIYRFLKNG